MWEALIPAFASIAASMFLKNDANEGAISRQRALQRSMEDYQRSKAQQNTAAINKLVDQQTPDKRAAELQGIDQSRQSSMQGTVDAARAASPVTQAAGTNTSADYQKANAVAADSVASRTKKAIEQLGLMGAPGEAGLASGIRFGRTAGNVDAGNQAIQNVGAGYMRDIDNVHPDPTETMLGNIGLAAGSAMAGGAIGGGAGAGAAAAGNADWGSLDAGPGAYTQPTSIGARLKSAFSAWGR